MRAILYRYRRRIVFESMFQTIFGRLGKFDGWVDLANLNA